MDLKNIETLVDRLTERVEALIDERNRLRLEVDRLTAYAAQRDQDCVNLRQEMARAVEAAAEEARNTDRTNAEIVTKLEALNDRMITLADQALRGELTTDTDSTLATTDSDDATPMGLLVGLDPSHASLALQSDLPDSSGRSEQS